MCKRIWDQELDRASPPAHLLLRPQLHLKRQEAGPKLWLRLYSSSGGSVPSSTHPLRFQVLRSNHPGLPPGLGSVQFSPSQPLAGGHWCCFFLEARGKPETGKGSLSSPGKEKASSWKWSSSSRGESIRAYKGQMRQVTYK